MVADLAKGKKLLEESGYGGEPVVIISPADVAYLHTLGQVTDDLLRRLGMKTEFVATDWGTVLTRRASDGPPDKGGWNVFHTTAVGAEFMSPASHLALRGNGKKAWPGWPSDDKMEELRTEWLKASGVDAERAIAERMEQQAFAHVPYVPLGQYRQATALRSNITGMIKAGAPFAWNIRKS